MGVCQRALQVFSQWPRTRGPSLGRKQLSLNAAVFTPLWYRGASPLQILATFSHLKDGWPLTWGLRVASLRVVSSGSYPPTHTRPMWCHHTPTVTWVRSHCPGDSPHPGGMGALVEVVLLPLNSLRACWGLPGKHLWPVALALFRHPSMINPCPSGSPSPPVGRCSSWSLRLVIFQCRRLFSGGQQGYCGRIPRGGGLGNRSSFSHCPGGCKSKINVWQAQSLPGLWKAGCLLMALPRAILVASI